MTKGRYVVCKMSMFVLSSGGGGQKWVKFGPRSCYVADENTLESRNLKCFSQRGIKVLSKSKHIYVHVKVT